MNIAEVKKNAEQKMNKSVESLKADLAKVRTGRAHTGILDHIQVDYYGSPTQISQVANVTLIDARTISVQPWEKKMISVIEKAIRDSDLGLNPSSVGDIIRVPTPPLTEERRKEYVKLAKGKAEDGKVAVRNIRRKAKESLDKAIKDGEMGEDEGDRLLKELDKITKQTTDELDTLLEAKQKEIMEV